MNRNKSPTQEVLHRNTYGTRGKGTKEETEYKSRKIKAGTRRENKKRRSKKEPKEYKRDNKTPQMSTSPTYGRSQGPENMTNEQTAKSRSRGSADAQDTTNLTKFLKHI